MSEQQFQPGDRVRTHWKRSATRCSAYPDTEYLIIAGPFAERYDDGSATWTEYVGLMIDGDFRDRPYHALTAYTIDAATCEAIIPPPCEKCGQTEWHGGEHPCPACGRPQTWDPDPKPGEVVVALDAEDAAKWLAAMRRNQTGGVNSDWYNRGADALEAALDRAREAAR